MVADATRTVMKVQGFAQVQERVFCDRDCTAIVTDDPGLTRLEAYNLGIRARPLPEDEDVFDSVVINYRFD